MAGSMLQLHRHTSLTSFPVYWDAAPTWGTQMSLQWVEINQTLTIPADWNFLLEGNLNIHSGIKDQKQACEMLFCRVRWKRLNSTTRSFAKKTSSWRTTVSASRSRTQTCRLSSRRSRYGCLLNVNLEYETVPLMQHHFLFACDLTPLILILLNRHGVKSCYGLFYLNFMANLWNRHYYYANFVDE